MKIASAGALLAFAVSLPALRADDAAGLHFQCDDDREEQAGAEQHADDGGKDAGGERLGRGFRLAANDLRAITLLCTAITDLRDGSTVLNAEGSLRLGERWKFVMEARGFGALPPDDFPLNGFRTDPDVQIGPERHF